MKGQIQEILRHYGQSVTLESAAGEKQACAFLQPVTQRGEQELDQMTPLGAIDGRTWLYLGIEEVQTGDRIRWNETEFQVRSSRSYWMGDVLLYWWAALERAKEAVS